MAEQLRLLAAIYLKNNVGRYWAPRDQDQIPVAPDEKAHLRRRYSAALVSTLLTTAVCIRVYSSLELMDDESDAVAVQKVSLT